MNIKMRHLAVIATGLLMTTGIIAKEKIATVGAGGLSCGEIVSNIKDHQDDAADFIFAWAQGFLTGLNFNYGEADGTDLSDRAGQKLWLENYCNKNPLHNYLMANMELWTTLRAMQGLTPDPRPGL